MQGDVSSLFVSPTTSIRNGIGTLDATRKGIVLVVDEEQRLVGTVTDGDARRAMLAEIDLNEPVTSLLAQKSGSRFATPITAQEGSDPASLLRLLRQHSIHHLPLVDQNQRVVDMVSLEEFVPEESPLLHAVIMAGGVGSRLRPLTEDLPKPMLPVSGRPLMELIIEQLKSIGIEHVNVTVRHRSEKIMDHFGDGSGFGVEITYLSEDRPLGTAGALGLMEVPRDTTLVINGDILTTVDFRAMQDYHRKHKADLTVAVQQNEVHVPYGIIECEDVWVQRLVEKPVVRSLINAGIYLLEPTVFQHIPKGGHFDMTDLIQRLLDEGMPVAAFPIHEYWIDIGQLDDYKQAQEHMAAQDPEP